MNKAIELLNNWITHKEEYLVILVDRMDYQKKHSESEDEKRAAYFAPEYMKTKEQVETLQREVAECKQALQSILYPSIPAPKPELVDDKFTKVLDEAWAFIKGDGHFTGPDLKQWTNGIEANLSRQVLCALIQTIWSDYGGKDFKEVNN